MDIHEYYGISLLISEHEKGRLIDNHHCVYFMQEANITNPYILEMKMYDDGYFRPATLEERLQHLKVSELKKILEEKQLSRTGNKPVLIERLLPHCDYLMDTPFENTLFYLSQKGMQFAEDNKDLFLYHKYNKYSPPLEEYFKMREQYNRNYHGICWRYFESLLKEKNIRHDFISGIAFHTGMLGLYKQSLYYYLLNIYVSLNLMDCPWMLDKDCLVMKKDIVDFENEHKTMCLIFEGDIAEIIKLKDYYYDGIIEEIYNDYPTEHKLITPKIFFYLVNDIFTKPYFDSAMYIQHSRDIYLEKVAEMLDDGQETTMQHIASLLGRR